MSTQGRTRQLFGKLFLFITPVFVLLSATGVYLLTEEQQTRAEEHLATSLGNSTARVAAAITRLEERMPIPTELRDEIAVELLNTLMGDLSIRCAQLVKAGSDTVLMAPQGVGCRVQTAEATLTRDLSGSHYGPLTVGYTQAPIREAAVLQRWYALIIMVGAITMALLSGWFAFRVIVGRPLDRMVESLVDAKNDAEAANVSKSRFLANMSHEIRTPLNGMIGTAELLNDTKLNGQQRRAVQTIRTSGQALLKIIQDVLDYSKIESHTLQLQEAQFSLYDLVYDVAEMMSSMTADAKVDICVDYPAGKRRRFFGDEGRLRQVIVNLMGNAVKFTEVGHVTIKITVSETLGRSNVRIAVQDTGIGIREEHLATIFSPFTQADDSTTRKYGGTGLGLAITRDLVGLMGGKLGASSEYGRGSTFEVALPLAHGVESGAEDQDLKALRQRAGTHPRQRILAIGVGLHSADVVAGYFSAIGWTLDRAQAENAMASVEAAVMSGHRYSAFLIDAALPDHIRGMISQALRAQPETSAAPILMSVPVASKLPAQEAGNSPVSGFVTKPLRADKLIRAIVQGLESEEITQDIPSVAVEVEDKLEDFSAMLEAIPVLVVDDSAVNREVVSQQLSITGAEVHTAENGEVAVTRYKEIEPAVVLMDISMPVLDGISAAERIRAWEALREIEPATILALSANVLDEQKRRCAEAGMNGFIPKPSSRDHILRRIREAILDDGGDGDDFAPQGGEPTGDTAATCAPAPLPAPKGALQPAPQPALAPIVPAKPASAIAANSPLHPGPPVRADVLVQQVQTAANEALPKAEDVVDLEMLKELAATLPSARFRSIVEELQGEASALMEAFDATPETASLVPDIHKVAGSSGMIGCSELCGALQQLELRLKKGEEVPREDLLAVQRIWAATTGALTQVMEDA